MVSLCFVGVRFSDLIASLEKGRPSRRVVVDVHLYRCSRPPPRVVGLRRARALEREETNTARVVRIGRAKENDREGGGVCLVFLCVTSRERKEEEVRESKSHHHHQSSSSSRFRENNGKERRKR